MDQVLAIVAKSLGDICGIDPAEITPEKHIFEDLGVDSLDFLDVTFEIDRALKIKLPIEEKLAESKESNSPDIFLVGNFVTFVQSVCAAKAV